MISLNLRVILFLLWTFTSFAQSSKPNVNTKTLFDTIRKMDKIFFDAFNECDTTKTKSLFTKDLEFYHDNGGLTNYEQNLRSIRSRCSSRVKVRRELVESSLEVFPIADYGAIEVGEHRFYYTEPGKDEILDGTFKFVHIWTLQNDKWKISRVISYNH